jgi:hypothetical protein
MNVLNRVSILLPAPLSDQMKQPFAPFQLAFRPAIVLHSDGREPHRAWINENWEMTVMKLLAV